MVAPFTVESDWTTWFDGLMTETIGRSADGAEVAAQRLADYHPGDALMVAYGLEHTTTQWGDGPDFRSLSDDIVNHLIPMLRIRVLDNGIEQPLTVREPEPGEDPRVPVLNYVLAMGVLKSRYTWLTFMHVFLSTGMSWEEAEAKVQESNLTHGRAAHPDSEPEWRVLQPGYWEL